MELAEVVGQLAVLRRFPVRALGGESPDECLVQGSGLAGDRILSQPICHLQRIDRSLQTDGQASLPVL